MAPVRPDSITISAYLNSSWVDLSSDVLGRGGLSADWGIDGNGPMDFIAGVGSLKLTLWNYTGQYYPDGSSPLSGWTFGVPIRVVIVYGAYTKTLRYYIEKINPRVKKTTVEADVEIDCLDWMIFAQKYPILAPIIETDKTADYGLSSIVSAMTPVPQATDFDTGNYIFPSIFDGIGIRTTAYSEFARLVTSEYGHLYLTKDSTYGETLVFENLTARNSGTAAATFDTDIDDISLSYGENIVNRATAVAYPKRIDDELQVLYSLGKAMPIKAGETINFRAKYIDPEGGGTRVNALVDTMQTPAVPGDPDPYMMTLLNFPTANIEADVTDDTGRHSWQGNDVSSLNDSYLEVITGITRITGGVFGCYAIFGGYANYKLTVASSDDFNFGSGPFTIGYWENRLNPEVNSVTLTRSISAFYSPFYLSHSNGVDMQIFITSNGYSWDIAYARKFGKVTRGQWVYRELCRDEDGWFYAFANGALIEKWHSPLAILSSSGTMGIGYSGGVNQYTFMGLDSFFIKKGECLHRTDFDVPRRPFSATLEGDYLMNTAENGTGTDLSSSLAITATYDSTSVNYELTNNSAQDAFITHLQARGRGIYPYDPIEFSVEDATSITTYGHQEINIDQKYQTNLYAGNAVTNSVVTNEKNPRTALESISYYANRSAARMADALTLDVGSLIRVVNLSAGIDNYYYIQNVDMSVKPLGLIYVAYGVKPAYAIDPDFGGGGGGNETDDGTIGVGGSLGGAQRGAVVRIYAGNVDVTQVHELAVNSAYVEVYSGNIDEITVDTILVDSAYVTVHNAQVGIPGYVEQHNILSPQHGDTTAANVVRGDIVTGQGATPKWARLAASVPGGAGLLNVLAYAYGAVEAAWTALFDATAPTTIQPDAAAAAGTATTAAHRDHTHAIVAAAASEIAGVQAAGEGTSTSFARADHAHQIQHGISDNHLLTVDQADAADNDFAKFTVSGIEGRSYAETRADLDLEAGTDFPSLATFNAHKDRHDPNDGADPLDTAAPSTNITPEQANATGTAHTLARSDHMHYLPCAAPGTNITPEQANAEGTAASFARSDHMHYIPSGAASEIAGVQAAAEGTGAAFARIDHAHQIQHGISDNHIVTIDHASVADNDYAKFTANGLEGRSYAEVLADLGAISAYLFPFSAHENLVPLTGSSGNPHIGTIGETITFVSWNQAFYVATTNDASNYWNLHLLLINGAVSIASFTTASYSAGTYYNYNTTSFSPTSADTTSFAIYLWCSKTGSPGALYAYGPWLKVTPA